MTRDKIFDIIVQHTRAIIPELEKSTITESDSLVDLGANSLDRADIIMLTLESCCLEVPLVEFAGVKSLGELTDRVYEKCHSA